MDSGRPPQLTSKSITGLLKLYYGFEQILEDSVKQFPSYYDSNFYFRGLYQNESEGEYMLKILNRVRISTAMASGISDLWSHLNENGLSYTSMLPNKKGKRISTLTVRELVQFEVDQPTEAVLGLSFSVRVMRFVPGEVFDIVDKRYLTPQLLFQVGAFVGKIDTALKNGFHNSAIESRYNVWDTVHFPSLRQHISSLDDSKKQELVEKSLSGFEVFVLPRMADFQKGIIYNDASGQNIMVQKIVGKEEYEVVGMIDFDETVHSSYVFDLSVCLAYIMMENLSPANCSGPIEFVAQIVHGFTSVFPLSSEERQCLYYLTLARCCQSAVYGELSFKAEPWNEYMLTTPRKSWKVIDLMLSAGKDYVDKAWGTM